MLCTKFEVIHISCFQVIKTLNVLKLLQSLEERNQIILGFRLNPLQYAMLMYMLCELNVFLNKYCLYYTLANVEMSAILGTQLWPLSS